MNREDVEWKGYWAAVTTPFTESGALDLLAFRDVLRLHRHQGVNGVLVNGTSGEWFSQTDAERRQLAEVALDELSGVIPVVIGCTSLNAVHTSSLASHALAAGADGVMATPPPYIVPTEEEIVAFYDTISDSVAVPLMVYNWPPGTNVDMSPATIRRLARIEHVVAVKDSTSDKAKLAETTAAVAGEIRVFGDFINDFGITVMRQHGGDGYIGGGALLGSLLPEFFAAVESGDVARAHEIAQINVKLNAQLVNEDWTGCYGPLQSQVKAAMNLMGQPGGFTRPPRLPITDHGKLSSLSAALESVGLTISPKTLSPMLADG